MFQFFFLFTKIQKFTKIWLKKRFFGVWNDSCQYPKFLGFAKIWKLPNLPKMSKWPKSILDFFLLIFMKNMTFHVSHATQELLGKQKMSKMFRQMKRNARWQRRRPRYRAVAYVPNFAILVPAPELSLSDGKNNPFRKMRDTLYRERQLWSGNESVEIRYVSGSSVAGTSASSPGVPRHIPTFIHMCSV